MVQFVQKEKWCAASIDEVACVVYYYRLLYIQNYFIFFINKFPKFYA